MRRSLYLIVLLLAAIPVLGQPQNGNAPQKQDWRERLKAEKIAYLTTAVGLTPAEAEKFWPVYNQAEAEKGKAFESMFNAYKELDAAIKEGKKDKEIARLLDRYLASLSTDKAVDVKYAEKYRTILTEAKVARLFLAEEKFRRDQINRLRKADTKPSSHTDY